MKNFISRVYGMPDLHRRTETWNQLISFKNRWIAVGDFDQVMFSCDKLSFKSKELRGASDFIECINFCNLIELHSNGQYLMWTNNRIGEDSVWERLEMLLG